MPAPTQYLVLCPMQFEFRRIRKGLAAVGLNGNRVQVIQTGIGSQAIAAAIEEHGLDPKRLRGVILAGLCGGLRPTAHVPQLREVVDRTGNAWPIGASGWADRTDAVTTNNSVGVRLIGVDELIPSPAQKRSLAEETDSDIVDMESHELARRCHASGVPWTVVRGVSDHPEDVLPEDMLNWIDHRGNSRTLRAVRDMTLRPSLIRHAAKAIRQSNAVLPQVAERVAQLIYWREAQT